MVAQFFVLLGFLSRKYGVYEKVKNWKNHWILVIYLIFVLIDKIFFKSIFDIHMGIYGVNVAWYAVLAILGVIILIQYESFLPKSKIISFIGSNSLLYYGLQYSVIVSLKILFNRFGLDTILGKNIFMRSCATVYYFIICVIVLYMTIYMLNKLMKYRKDISS